MDLSSSASFHSSSCRELHNFKGGKLGKVYHADDEVLDIMGKGDASIKASCGITWKLENVW